MVELGAAHVNLEECLRLGSEPTRARLPLSVQATGRRVGSVTVSVQCLEALRWAKRAVEEEAHFGLTVADLALAAPTAQRHASLLAARKVAVQVALPATLAETIALHAAAAGAGAGMLATNVPRGWSTPAARLVNGRFGYKHDVAAAAAHAGSAAHALLALLDAAAAARLVDESDVEAAAADVYLRVVAVSGAADAPPAAARSGGRGAAAAAAAAAAATDGKERLLGVARINLVDLLESGTDVSGIGRSRSGRRSTRREAAVTTSRPPPRPAWRRGRRRAGGGQVGTLTVQTSMLKALQIAHRQLVAQRAHAMRRASPAVPSAACAAATSSPAAPSVPCSVSAAPSTGVGIGGGAVEAFALRAASVAAGVTADLGGGDAAAAPAAPLATVSSR